VRIFVYGLVGLVFTILAHVFALRFGLNIDFAWVVIAVSVFCLPEYVAPVLGMVFGLVLDGLSGSGCLIYTVSYGCLGWFTVAVKRAFYLKGFIAGWILAVIGAELLWLFIAFYSQVVALLGGTIRPPTLVSPFLLSTLVLFPGIYILTKFLGVSGKRDEKVAFQDRGMMVKI